MMIVMLDISWSLFFSSYTIQTNRCGYHPWTGNPLSWSRQLQTAPDCTVLIPVPCCLLCWALGVGPARYISSSNGSCAKRCPESQGKNWGSPNTQNWGRRNDQVSIGFFLRFAKKNNFNDFLIKNVFFFPHCHFEWLRRNGKETWVDVTKIVNQ